MGRCREGAGGDGPGSTWPAACGTHGMTLIELLITLVVFGVVLYLITLIPMDATVRTIIRVLAILFLVLFVCQQLGWISGHSMRLN